MNIHAGCKPQRDAVAVHLIGYDSAALLYGLRIPALREQCADRDCRKVLVPPFKACVQMAFRQEASLNRCHKRLLNRIAVLDRIRAVQTKSRRAVGKDDVRNSLLRNSNGLCSRSGNCISGSAELSAVILGSALAFLDITGHQINALVRGQRFDEVKNFCRAVIISGAVLDGLRLYITLMNSDNRHIAVGRSRADGADQCIPPLLEGTRIRSDLRNRNMRLTDILCLRENKFVVRAHDSDRLGIHKARADKQNIFALLHHPSRQESVIGCECIKREPDLELFDLTRLQKLCFGKTDQTPELLDETSLRAGYIDLDNLAAVRFACIFHLGRD